MRRAKPTLTFITDSREQRAFRFAAPVRREFQAGGTIILGLPAGDYSVSLDGLTALPIALERKSLGDFYGVCGFGRERFVRELEKLRELDYAAIIIEASADQILRGYERSRISGRSAMASLCCWSVEFRLPIIFAENHRRAGGIAQRLLEEFAIHHLRRERAAWQDRNGRNSTLTSMTQS